MTQPTFHDIEKISAYLDGHLSPADALRLEQRASSNEDFARAIKDMREARIILRQLPARRAPRNFTLTPKMAGIRPPVPRAFSFLQLASAVLAVLFAFTYITNISQPALAYIREVAPPLALGRGGGGGGGDGGIGGGGPNTSAAVNPPAADIAPNSASPKMPTDNGASGPAEAPAATAALPENTPTQVSTLFNAGPTPAPTETPFTAAAIQPTEQPAGQPGVDQSNAASKAAPEATPEPVRTPIQLPIPANLQLGLLVLAVVSGGAGYFLRLVSERNWYHSRALPGGKPGLRQVLLILLLVALVIGLILSIVWVSNTTFYAFVPTQQPAFGDKAIVPIVPMADKALPANPGLGDKALNATQLAGKALPGSNGNLPGTPDSGLQFLDVKPGIGYAMYHYEPNGLLTELDFAENTFTSEARITYTPGLTVPGPTFAGTSIDRSFSISAPPSEGSPANPYSISIDYGADIASSLPDENKLVLEYWDGSQWRDAAGTCNPAGAYERSLDIHRLKIQVCTLGEFLLFAVP